MENQIDIDDTILATEISMKFTIRQLLQIAVMAELAKGPENQCQSVYDTILDRLHRLPQKTRDRFVIFQDQVFGHIGPEWPEQIEEAS